jgi:S1-C subfamily serine protease
VARITGTAAECGRTLTGSGFVAGPDRVITNAHVVAGVSDPVVELPGAPVREGEVVYFDPVDDLAVIAVPDLGVAPLAVAGELTAGDAAIVQGYPFGGPFTAVAASIQTVADVPVPDIYGSSEAVRRIYAMAATVQPGNSGGPVLTPGGAVAGVVFARADDGSAVGYAMTTAELMPVLAQVPELHAPAATGACVG